MSLLSRRELIQTGVAGAAVLALANCARSNAPGRAPFDDPSYPYKILGPGDRATMAAIGGAMLAGALPPDKPAYAIALVEVVRGVDIAAAGLAPGPQGELQQLFGLLSFPVTRGFAGRDLEFVERCVAGRRIEVSRELALQRANAVSYGISGAAHDRDGVVVR